MSRLAHPVPAWRRAGSLRVLRRALVAAALVALPAWTPRPLAAQEGQLTREMMERGLQMLAQVRKDLQQSYYDSTFGGVDMMGAKYEQAEASLRAAKDNNQLLGAIAQYVSELRDSHTKFWPPAHVAQVNYGFGTRFVGDSLYVTVVGKGSDAEAKGLRVGDVVLRWDAFKPDRSNFWMVEYIYTTLSPRPGIKLTVRGPGESPREVLAMAKITKGERVADYTDINRVARLFQEMEDDERSVKHFSKALGDSILLWRFAAFYGEDNENLDEMMKRAKKYRALVVDLRNNGGGSGATLEYFVSKFFDRDVTIGTQITRRGKRQWIAKATDKDPYRGMLVILLNANSASASEVSARALQQEGRAIIVGDRSKGAVVGSSTLWHTVGHTKVLSYGVQVSFIDLVMPDGVRLENTGVTPDHLVLPTGADIAAGRDPQMTKALALAGYTITPEAAARIWSKSK
jgi:carboxyl-terminal processing protease